MNELERSSENGALRRQRKPIDQRALYDRFGAMAYGIILQILPQNQAHEVLLEVFKSVNLLSFSNPAVSPAITIIRMARAKAFEYKEKTGQAQREQIEPISSTGSYSPESIFDLTFRQGYSFEAISEQSGISKPEILRAIRDYFQMFHRS
ncbi:hypothetical protein [Larkinella terrae]|uniref:Uncharacterized protein n=1 Tax=Larkinella terrae TaxID=2025311 RepID=A0A7K0EDS0_9BACT|nr:hypothetical protein [Larkinella terrae]MRS59741.1 hypothetical protein [Larkinella terrae]